MFGCLKHRHLVLFTSTVLVLLVATGAISRRMRLAAEQAIAAPASACNSLNTSTSAPLSHYSNPAPTRSRPSEVAREWKACFALACVEFPVAHQDLNAGDCPRLRAPIEVLTGQRSLQAWSVRWQV